MNYFKGAVVGCLIALSTVVSLQAQWNAIAGYMVSSADADPVNQLLQAYNVEHKPSLPFKDIKVLNGFTAGIRYHYPLGAFEMVYNRRFTRRIGDQFHDTAPDFTGRSNADFFYEIRTFSMVSEFGGVIRMGASLDYNTYLMEMKFAEPEPSNFKIKQRPLGSRFFIGTHIKNRPNLSFSVRAFYQVLWSDISTEELMQNLELTKDLCTDCNFRPSTIGLSIIINNGVQ
ncbi:MAG: hypothetical protein IPL46_27575 [Saprospiraceae bacterium]|nr:hypothetical protein [Saprospiraceae bacterium]